MNKTPADILHSLQLTPWIALRGGGVSWYIHQLITHGRPFGLQSTLAGLDHPGDRETPAGVPVITGRLRGPGMLGYAPDLLPKLRAGLPADLAVVHAHGLRMLPLSAARRLAQERRLPLVISPHGQLDPWVRAERPIRKAIVGWLYDNRNQRSAACFHATCVQEARHIRAAGLRVPICVAGIGLDAQPYLAAPDESALRERWPALQGKRRLLYLTTIYRKKGLLTLAATWAKLSRSWPDWHLVVGGREVQPLVGEARRILAKAGALERVSFIGPVEESDKRLLLAGCQLYVLPTLGENFGISIAESLASGTPVIVSRTAPWAAVAKHRCGWWIEVGRTPLEAALNEALGQSDDDLRQMGLRGRELILQDYHWPELAHRVVQAYRWLAGHAPQPAHVYRPDQPLPADDASS